MQKFKKKSETGSTGYLTDRTIRSEKTIAEQKPKTLSFTIKRQLFSKSKVQKLIKTNTEKQRFSSPPNHRLYRSLESKNREEKNLNFQTDSSTINQLRCKTENKQHETKKITFPIDSKSSSDKNKFTNSFIRSYGLATCKSTHKITNNHMILINLGLIKEFYLIEAIDGFQSATHVKKNISFLLLKEYLNQVQKHFNKNKLKSLENAVYETFSKLKSELIKMQMEKHDNSGCFITALLIIHEHVFTVNCGMGSSVIFTKNFKQMNGSQPHSTSNENEIKRITKAGSQFYRTQFNVKYKEKLSVKGPLRLYPSGAMFTRVLGKYFDKMAENHHKNPSAQNPEESDREVALISEPEVSYIEAENVQFVLISSYGLQEFMKKSLMCSIVLHEVMKYSLTFTIHDLAKECANQILYQAYLRGYDQTASVLIVFIGLNVDEIKKKQNQAKINKQKENEFKSPFKYVGNRKSFVKYESF